MIALGTNNDLDVSQSSGASFANRVVDPVVRYASKYAGMTIAGANDMEPGFRATYAQSSAWLTGYLGATQAPYVSGAPVWDVVANHLKSGKPPNRDAPGVALKGVDDNPGMSGHHP
jgi:hypothetical protein